MHEHARGRERSREKGVNDKADKRGHNVRSQIRKMVTDGINNIPPFLDREGHISFVASKKRQRCRYECVCGDRKQRNVSLSDRVLCPKRTR